jgi:hypothetical protein
MMTNRGVGAARRALGLCAAVPLVAAMCWLGCSASSPPTDLPPQVDPVSVAASAPAPAATSAPAPAPAGDDAGATAADAVAPTSAGKECTTSADCGSGQMCDGPEGCDAKWTCQAPKPCTRDLVPYCGCDGKTVRGSSRCAPAKYSKKGECGP